MRLDHLISREGLSGRLRPDARSLVVIQILTLGR